MRVTNVFSGRPGYYDRNAATKVNSGNQTSIAPHGAATRWTYTVPTGRKFQILLIQFLANRNTVAGTPANVLSYSQITPNGGSLATMAYLQFEGNAVDSGKHTFAAGGATLVAGDVITGLDSDASVGGTCDFGENMTGTEFDA